MSWVKSISLSGEDVFDENADELNLQSREWTSNMKKRVRDGYVDGVDAGEDASLQLGFNIGFREGAAQTVAVGRLKGIVCAIRCWCQSQHPENSQAIQTVSELLNQVTQHEDTITERIRKTLENPPPSVSDVSEGIEDLEVGHPSRSCCGEGCKETDCCRADKMDIDAGHLHQPHRLCSGSNDSFDSEDKLIPLLQRCVELATELGLPQELIGHIEELRNIKLYKQMS